MLHVSTDPIDSLSDAELLEVGALFSGMLEQGPAPEVFAAGYRARSSHVIRMRAHSGTLVGVAVLMVIPMPTGQAVLLHSVGIQASYRRTPWMPMHIARTLYRLSRENAGETHLVTTILNPQAYAMIVGCCPTAVPRPGCSPAQEDYARQLGLTLQEAWRARSLSVVAVDSTDGLAVRLVGAYTQQPACNELRRDHPLVRYFIEKNPGFMNGDMLVVVTPVQWSSVLRTLLMTAWQRRTNLLRRATRHPTDPRVPRT